MSIDGYKTDARLLRAIEQLAGIELTGCDHPENSVNAADRLWVDGYTEDLDADEAQRRLLALLPPPTDDEDEIFWGDSRWAVAKNGLWVIQ